MKTLFTLLLQCLTTSIVFSQGLTLPYYTGYDSPSEKAGWQEYRTGFLSTYSWSYSNGGAFSAPTCVAHGYNVGGNATDTVVDWFVSPPLNFTSQGILSVRVGTSGFSIPMVDNFEVWFGTNNPDPATGNFVLIANLSYMLPQFQWLDTTVNVSFVSDSGYIAFKYKTIGAAWSDYKIDNINVSIVSGIDNADPEKSLIKIFPNPVSTSVTIEFNSTIINGDLNIYDLYGQKIKTIKNISGNKIKLDRNNLQSGIYFIRLQQDGKTMSTGKLIIAD